MRDLPVSLRVRQAGAATLVAGLALVCAHHAVTTVFPMHRTEGTACAALLGAAAFAFTRRSLFAQVFARGTAWVMMGSILSVFASGDSGMWWAPYAVLACAAALVLGHPLLHTPEARASFAPARFRRLFLAGATATAAVAASALYYAAFGIHSQIPLMTAFDTALAATLLLAIRGLLGMRTWGALLGGFAAVVCLASGPFWQSTSSAMTMQTLSLAAAPMLIFWGLPIVAAQLSRLRRRAPSLRLRVGDVLAHGPLAADHAFESERLLDDEAAAPDESELPRRALRNG